MKFTRYLEDTQTPEWKRAYIDYRVFKDMIRAIRRAQDGMALNPVESYSNSQINRPAASMLSAILQSESGDHSSQTSSIHLPIERRDLTFIDVPSRERAGVSGHNSTDRQQRRPSLRRTPTPQNNVAPPSPGGALASPQLLTRQLTNRSHLAPPSAGGDAATSNSRHLKTSAVPQLIIRQWTNNSQSRQVHGDGMPSSPVSRIAKSFSQFVNPMRRHPYSELSLNSLMLLLSPPELAFFSVLDAELQKVESFYLEREKAMQLRTRDLEAQVNELNEHKKLFDANHRPEASLSWTARLNAAWTFGRQSRSVARTEVPAIVLEEPTSTALPVEGLFSGNTKTEETRDHGQGSRRLNPKEYLAARRKLKRAVLEHYRGLEMLHNYRVLNLYGFRRVLHKFEKSTKIPCQRTYMEKVDNSTFGSDESLRVMMEGMQSIFATSFTCGDRRKAISRLRAGPQYKSHHGSVFWSGIAIGSAAAAVALGIAYSFQQETRAAIPGWDGLLFIYAVLAIPVFFSLLIGLNLLVWARARINYVFMFELDLRTRLDHREYFQTPSILFASLCYAFWLSFARIGTPSVSPAIWPLVWLACATVLMLDPFPILFKPSRYWLLKNVGKLLISGSRRVEFTDFWLGDQFCSLVFTLSNLPLIGCVYSKRLDADWRKCGTPSSLWPLTFLLAVLPFLVRLIQSIRRYVDSKLTTHLVNAGKYGAGIVSYFCYFLWRHRGGHHDASFVLWILSNASSATYALVWDFLMDWSIFRPHARNLLLRQDLLYSQPLYYFAIASNTVIRFLWVLYIPRKGPDMMLRSSFVGFLEVLRRWQWNVYRLENEHLGNVDQYRVTREVPLPYSLDARGDGDEEDGRAEIQKEWASGQQVYRT